MKSYLDEKTWKMWLDKDEWSIAEATALSVGIPPDALEIERHIIPTQPMTEDVWNWLHDKSSSEPTGDITFGSIAHEVPPMPNQSIKNETEYWTLRLREDQTQYGKTIEALTQKRVRHKILGDGLAGLNGIKLNPSIPKFKPTAIIKAMQYEEWELPIAITGEKESLPSNQPSNESTGSINEYLNSLGKFIYREQAKILTGVKDFEALKRRWEDGEIPAPRKATMSATGGKYEWLKEEWVVFFKNRSLDPNYVYDPVKKKQAKLRHEQAKLNRQREKQKKIS